MVPVCCAPLRLISTPWERGCDTRAQVSLDTSLCSFFSTILTLPSWTTRTATCPGWRQGCGVSVWMGSLHPSIKHTCNDSDTKQFITGSSISQTKLLVWKDNVSGKICSQGKPLKQPETFLLQFSTSGPPARR